MPEHRPQISIDTTLQPPKPGKPVGRRAQSWVSVATILLVLAGAACHQDAFAGGDSEALLSCSKGQLGGTSLSHGVVLSHFPGRTLDSVTLWLGGHIDSVLSYRYEVHRDAFDGPLVRKGTGAVFLSATEMPVTLPTLSPTAGAGSNYTIVLTLVSGSANPWISTFTPAGCTGVYYTQGTTPPLDTPAQTGIPVVAYGKM